MPKLCSACEKPLKPSELKSCTVCDKQYHYQCLRLSSENFAKESKAYKASWKCPQCKASEKRSDNANTPVRQPAPPIASAATGSPAHKSPSPTSSSSCTDLLKLQEYMDSSFTRFKTEILKEVSMKLEGHYKTLAEKTSKIDDSINYLSGQYDAILGKVKTMENSIKDLEQQRDQLLQETRAVKNKFSAFEKKHEKIECSLNSLSDFYDDLKQENKVLAAENSQLKAQIVSLNKSSRDIQQQSDDSQSYITSKFIEIRNVPPNTEDNLLDYFNNLCTALSIDFKPNHICNIYRKRAYKQNSQHILIELNCVSYKRDLLSAVKQRIKHKDKLSTQHLGMHGDPRNIYISELLSPKQKYIYFKARQHAKTHNYEYCWIKNGKIYLRKHKSEPAILVSGEEQLAELASSRPLDVPASPGRRSSRDD